MSDTPPTGDPRLDLPVQRADDIRPVVAGRSWGPSGLAIGAGLALFAVLLFLVLESRRQSLEAPSVRAGTAAAPRGSEPPPLYVPPAAPPVALAIVPASPGAGSAPQTVPFVLPQPPTRQPRYYEPPQPPTYVPPPGVPPMGSPVAQPPMPQPPIAEAEGGSGAALVLDRSGASTAEAGEAGAGAPPAAVARVTATTLANRSTTVPQGTLIPAVLETGFDSTKAGFARAIVSRDVRGFDGKRILIPRGSRLVGDYAGGAEAGQKRAIINWTRLVRPDGVTIAIGSPATDAMGRNGVRARVNSHLLERIFPAVLQSALDIGVNLASRPANGSLLLSLPGAAGGSGIAGGQNQPTPTLSVRPGTSIAIFVSRDLDFTGVGNP